MAKLRKNQKVYRVKFAVSADIICSALNDGDDPEDEAWDEGFDAEYQIEQALREAGFQRVQAAVDGVTTAPEEVQNKALKGK